MLLPLPDSAPDRLATPPHLLPALDYRTSIQMRGAIGKAQSARCAMHLREGPARRPFATWLPEGLAGN